MTADVELLPCPFCGSAEHLHVEHLEGTSIHPAYRVRCDFCGASTRYTDRDYRTAWNTRTNVAPATTAKDAEAANALKAAREDAWLPIETAPKDGNCLLAIETDDGYTFAVLERDKKGNWIHEGEPTYRHGYYFSPTHWRPLPAPPAIDAARKEVGGE